MKMQSSRYGVRKRGDKWTARPYIPGLGKKVWTGTFETEAEAVTAAIQAIEEMRVAPASTETIEQAARRWMRENQSLKPSTVGNYQQAVNVLVADFGSRQPREIERPTARDWALAHPSYRSPVRTFFAWLHTQGIVTSNPFENLRLPGSKGRHDLVVLTEDELDLLMETAREVHPGKFGRTMAGFIGFMAAEGCRTSETLGLDWGQIDFEQETVLIERQFYKRQTITPKNGRKRTILLLPAGRSALCEVEGREGAIFRTTRNDRLSQASLSIAWKPVRTAFEARLDPARLAELQDSRPEGQKALVPYELRHLCATRMMERFAKKGEDGAAAVAHQLGHTDHGKLVKQLYGRHQVEEFHRGRIASLYEEPALEEIKEAVNA